MERTFAWVGLLKIRLSLAVTFSAVTGFLLYDNHPGGEIFYTIAGVFLLSSGAATLNQYAERHADALMNRTMHRPIPGYHIAPQNALLIAFFLLVTGSLILLITGYVPAILGLFTVFLYNIVYTSLKKVSWYAVVPGALVGAIPPLIGFTAAGGKGPDAGIILFCSFMFLWQLPHFWLIIMRYRNDYYKAGFKMLPEKIDDRLTKNLVFFWVTVTSLLLAIFSFKELIFDRIISLILIPMNICFILLFYRVLFIPGKTKENRGVKIAFILINAFSLAVMLLFIANSFLT